MAKNVILPALGMAQETGTILRWLKAEGDSVTQGETLAEIETDKATAEIEAPASGILSSVSASIGDEVPVGQVIAVILTAEEASSALNGGAPVADMRQKAPASVATSALAARITAEHKLDLGQMKPEGKRIQKADVLNYLATQKNVGTVQPRLAPASPKARRLAAEHGQDIASLRGSGPGGAILAADVLTAQTSSIGKIGGETTETHDELTVSSVWRIMAEHTTQSWTSVPHFFLVREVRANRLITWREQAQKRPGESAEVTYTDLLMRVVASTLREYPRVNASWNKGKIQANHEVNIGLAVAVAEGLVVPVIHHADTLNLGEIAQRRQDLVTRAHSGRLRPQDMSGGTFTISNLGMYGVDAFNAIINTPQAAILAVGRIADRVIPANGQAVVQPTMILSLSCDHRVIDGAQGAQFLGTLSDLLEEPLGLLN
ncbi:MAG TPA: dihydrolipoamide acetyltransferase family protein [Ktedonobacteraceae bacterium]|nr:dihydrolipoamide acetyltransferase family protein [Ktedonobacteraceae bacterium]